MTGEREILETEILAIGRRGDGVADTPHGPVFVPYTVPGDRVRLRFGGGATHEPERIADGPGRIAPACRHFGTCGGCALQHVDDDAYAAWKRDMVMQALAHRGVETDIAPIVRVPPGARRRARLGARVTRRGVILGFKERRSHRLVDIAECPVLNPDILAALPALRDALLRCLSPGESVEVSLAHVDGRLDIAVDSRRMPDLAMRERLAGFADEARIARLSWGEEPIVTRQPVRALIDGVAVDLPPGAFVQPTGEGESALRNEVLVGLAGLRNVADLYAGCGSFTLALAGAGMSVRAVELNPAQCAALVKAVQRREGGGRVDVEIRDLQRRPLAGREFDGLDGLVLDPPRAGAASQAQALASGPLPLIVYVSCNPATFARDARYLVDGGYCLERVAPIDQFLWSPHVELAALFRRQ